MEFTRQNMANPDQKTILLELAYRDIKEICKKFQDNSRSSNSEIKALLIELSNLWEREEKSKFGSQ